MKVIVPFSGGKDSQACLLYAIEKYGLKNVTAAFCDTSWENEITYRHIEYVLKRLKVENVVLTSEKYGGMIDLAIKKKRFPSTKSRFCTTELKVIPMINYILSLKDHLLIVQGIRSDESKTRSAMANNCRFFKYYFEPYETNSAIVAKLSGKMALSLVLKTKLDKAALRLSQGKEDKKYHTYRKKDVLAWCEMYSDEVVRPFFNATAEEVIDFSLYRGLDINPLYYNGFSRIGCFPCIMCTQKEIDLIVKNHPETVFKVKEAEALTGHTFFPPGKIPKRYNSKQTSKGKGYATFDDVIKYRNDKNATGDLFDNEADSKACFSVYSICE